MQKYTLMHKNTPCAAVSFDEVSGTVTSYHTLDPVYTPFLGNCDISRFKKWWGMRAVPASRELMRRVMRDAGILTPESYLVKNLALSMTDTYWICPEGASLTYDDVSFTNFRHYGRSKIPYHNATSYDPNASLGGSMDKYWDLSGDIPVLVKESYKYYGQQAVNEVFATRLHELQGTDVPFVRYTAARTADGGLISKCPAFTSERVEFIPAYEVIESGHIPNDINNYNAYIDIAAKHGISRNVMQKFMDYQTLTDFVISNTDEHLLNFGILRDPDTMELIGPAPIFDSGNSMFYSENRITPCSRSELLEKPITGFYKSEEKMLLNVKDSLVVNVNDLPAPDAVQEFYTQSGIPEEKAAFISQNYAVKASMVQDLQHGIRISLYQEKQKEKTRQERQEYRHTNLSNTPQQLIMLVGIPGSGKQAEAEKILEKMEEDGYHQIDGKSLYPVLKAEDASPWIVDIQKAVSALIPQKGDFKASVVVISPSSIREERREAQLPANDDMVDLIAYVRIRQAVLNSSSVIYSAENPDTASRENVLRLVGDKPDIYKKLVLFFKHPDPVKDGADYLKNEKMAQRLHDSRPSKTEGWDEVIETGEDSIQEKMPDPNDDFDAPSM